MTAKYGTPYFSNYINSDMEPSDVRSMAILGTQNVIYKDKFGRVSKNEIRHLVSNWINAETRPEYSILMNGKFVPVVDMFEVPYEKYDKYVTIHMANGQTQSFSYDHKCVVVRDGKMQEVLAQNVVSGDKVLLARHPYSESDIGSYEAGLVVGYYLAEGWIAHNKCEVDFAININNAVATEIISKFFKENFSSRVTIVPNEEKNIFKVKVFGKGAVGFVQQFISGDSALEKRVTVNTYDTSLEFRKGIYNGYYETDGCPKAKIFAHTTNKDLCKDMIDLFSTIGEYFRYKENPNNTRYFKPDKSDLQKFTSYKLIPITPEVFNDDYYTIDVTGVDRQDASRINKVYNFTVGTREHLYQLPNGIITHQCCRLRLDLRELRKKSGGYFGSGESTGSVGVVTINMPRLAYKSETEEDFYKGLDKLMDIAARSLRIKRETITKYLENGLYPYTKRYLGTFNNHFSTIGLVGMNEACLNADWIGKDLTDKKSQEFTVNVLNHMRERLSDYQELYGDLYNLEATPAESTSYRFAKHDVARYPDIITANMNGTPYYTNSSQLPVGFTDDIFAALDIQDEFQTLYTSGTVFHGFLGEKLPSWQSAAALVRKIAENYKLPYYTLSPTYSVCATHGYLTGEQAVCPHCGKPTEVYSRITGYYRPVQNWNDGKAQEFKDRKVYNIGVEHTPAPEPIKQEEPAKEEPDITPNNEAIREVVLSRGGILLFKTPTCPNCKIATAMLNYQKVSYLPLIATEEPDLVSMFGIRQAPTLVVIDETGNYTLYKGVSSIKEYIENEAKEKV